MKKPPPKKIEKSVRGSSAIDSGKKRKVKEKGEKTIKMAEMFLIKVNSRYTDIQA